MKKCISVIFILFLKFTSTFSCNILFGCSSGEWSSWSICKRDCTGRSRRVRLDENGAPCWSVIGTCEEERSCKDDCICGNTLKLNYFKTICEGKNKIEYFSIIN